MAIYLDQLSMQRDAISEMITVVDQFCLREKKPDGGYYGFPAALLLLSIANALGTIKESNENPRLADKHWKILSDSNYYNIDIEDPEVRNSVRGWFRNKLSHNARITEQCRLLPGKVGDQVFSQLTVRDGKFEFRLVPLLEKTKEVFLKFESEGKFKGGFESVFS